MRDVKLAARGSNVAHKGVQSGPLDDFKKKEKSMRIYSRDGNHYYYCDKKNTLYIVEIYIHHEIVLRHTLG